MTLYIISESQIVELTLKDYQFISYNREDAERFLQNLHESGKYKMRLYEVQIKELSPLEGKVVEL